MSGANVPVALIASVDRQRIIGSGNDLVWREPEDQRWFRRQTMGCPVVMGRKTWDSLPPRFRPLPGRANLVVTRQADWQSDGAQVAHTLADALAMARAAAAASGAARVFVIGGGQLFAEALPLADLLLLTEIDTDLVMRVVWAGAAKEYGHWRVDMWKDRHPPLSTERMLQLLDAGLRRYKDELYSAHGVYEKYTHSFADQFEEVRRGQ